LFRFSRIQLVLVFLALLLLRVSVGFHFFKEGTNKIKDGNFTAEYFLAGAKGPLAPFFQQMLDDPNGQSKLCVVQRKSVDGSSEFDLDPELTFLIWDDFVDKAIGYYGFGSPELQKTIAQRREETANTITQAREEGAANISTSALEEQRRLDEASILAIREQITRTEQIFEDHKEQLNDFLRYNRTALLQHFNTQDRLDGFQRDGQNRQEVAVYVDSLREQVETIKQDRKKALNEWTYEVTAIWDSLESQINDLAVDQQAEKPDIQIHRPFNQKRSRLKLINQFIPWFDTVVGALLIVGLFSRLASLAAGGFLASVIATQPPWIPGTDPTYLYAIELAACVVIFATCAGRFGGLDYFFSRESKRTQIETQEQQ
jgi:uncharacterized membrane protein YphA (DoxX/SURF4 family)